MSEFISIVFGLTQQTADLHVATSYDSKRPYSR